MTYLVGIVIRSTWSQHVLVFTHDHTEGQYTGCHKKQSGTKGRGDVLEEGRSKNGKPSLPYDAKKSYCDAHRRSQPEYSGRRIIQTHTLVLHEQLGETPAETSTCAGCHYEQESRKDEGCFRRDHKKHPAKDEKDDGNESQRKCFQTEEKCKEQDEDQRR